MVLRKILRPKCEKVKTVNGENSITPSFMICTSQHILQGKYDIKLGIQIIGWVVFTGISWLRMQAVSGCREHSIEPFFQIEGAEFFNWSSRF
jgi:hypothetical protein